MIRIATALALLVAGATAGFASDCDRARQLAEEAHHQRGADRVTSFQRALEFCPSDGPLQVALVRAYRADRRGDDAYELASRLLASRPSNADMLFERGSIRLERGERAAAHEDFLLATCYGHSAAAHQARAVQKELGLEAVQFVGVCPGEVMSAEALREQVLEAKPTVRPTLSFRNLTFETSEATLTEEARRQLDEVVRAVGSLGPDGNQQVTITGHADRRPFRGHRGDSVTLNCELSWARAQSVADYLAKGLDWPPSRITVVGRGNDQLLDEGDSMVAHGRNRRVDFWYGTPRQETRGCGQ